MFHFKPRPNRLSSVFSLILLFSLGAAEDRIFLERNGITVEFDQDNKRFVSSFFPSLVEASDAFSRALAEGRSEFIGGMEASTLADLRFLSQSFAASDTSPSVIDSHKRNIDELNEMLEVINRRLGLRRFSVWKRSKLIDFLDAGGSIPNLTYDADSDKLNFEWQLAVASADFDSPERLFSNLENFDANAPAVLIVLKENADEDLDQAIRIQLNSLKSFQSIIEQSMQRLQVFAYYELLTHSALKTLENLELGFGAPDLRWFTEGVAMTHSMLLAGERGGPAILKSIAGQHLSPVINGLEDSQTTAFLDTLENYDFTRGIDSSERFAPFLREARRKISFSASIAMMSRSDLELPFRKVLLEWHQSAENGKFNHEKLALIYEETLGFSPRSFFVVAQDRLCRSVRSGKLESLSEPDGTDNPVKSPENPKNQPDD